MVRFVHDHQLALALDAARCDLGAGEAVQRLHDHASIAEGPVHRIAPHRHESGGCDHVRRVVVLREGEGHVGLAESDGVGEQRAAVLRQQWPEAIDGLALMRVQ